MLIVNNRLLTLLLEVLMVLAYPDAHENAKLSVVQRVYIQYSNSDHKPVSATFVI